MQSSVALGRSPEKGEKAAGIPLSLPGNPEADFPLVLCSIFAILPPPRNGFFFCGKESVPVERFRSLTFFIYFFFSAFISHAVPYSSMPGNGRQPYQQHASGRNRQPFLPEPGNHRCGLRGWEAGCCPQGSPHPSCPWDESCRYAQGGIYPSSVLPFPAHKMFSSSLQSSHVLFNLMNESHREALGKFHV